MQLDVFESGIFIVAMHMPAGGTQVNFHVADERRFVAQLQHRAAKIRPAFDADKTGMKYADASAVTGFELVAPEALVLPDGLQQPLGRPAVVLAQRADVAAAFAPPGVEIFGGRLHPEKLWRRHRREVKPAKIFLNATKPEFACLIRAIPKFLFAAAGWI